MVTRKEIEESIEQNKSFIINWEVLDRLDLDFTQVEIEALLVDKYQDDKWGKWGYSLITTIYSKPNNEGVRNVYSVRWGFRGEPADVPYVCLDPYDKITGALFLDYEVFEDYEDCYRRDFSIIPQNTDVDESMEELDEVYESGLPIFIFYDPYEISVKSVEWKGLQTI